MSAVLSRRILFELGAGALAGTSLLPAAASAQPGLSEFSKHKETVREWYKLWETTKVWAPFDALLTDDFTFTSAAPDDHISKAVFKKNCWDTQINHIKNFDLELVMAEGDSVFVRYLCHTTSGKSFRNVEVCQLRGPKIASIECYFGGPAGYPTKAETQKD